MIDGFINVYKEQGYTSFDVVAKLRGILSQKKIGHTGTLDPLAEGVLLVCLGKATKLCDLLVDKNKEYICTLMLGKTSDTEDISGNIITESKKIPDEATVKEVIMSFVGEYSQVPPMYSAIKVNGKKLYELARQGKEVPRQPRQVFIYEIDILKVNIPEVTFSVKCSKGTYIRSLCRDIGEKLGCGGLMKSLIRTEVKGYRLADSMRLSEIELARDEGTLESHIVPIDHILKNMPKLFVANDMADKLLLNGNKLKPSYLKNEADGDLSSIIEACSRFCDDEEKSDITTAQSMVRIYDRKNNFTGIYRYDIEEKLFVPFKMFL